MKKFDNCRIRPESFQQIDTYIDSFQYIRQVETDQLSGMQQQERPWLSVVIPTFQRGELLREAVESVLRQKQVEFPWELLVVDNTPLDDSGSTPALEEIRRLDDDRIQYFHNRENVSIGYNWNRGVELASGTWICFLHDDDLLCSDALQHIGAQIRSYSGERPLGYLHARRSDFSGTFQVDSQKRYPPERLTRFGVMLSGCTGAGSPTCGTAILKQAYLETGGINYDFGSSADAVLCYQIMKEYAVICSDHILGGARWGDNETLRKPALLQLIQTDELFSQFTYKQTAFSSWWGRHFGAASSWRNIHRKRVIAKRYGLEIDEEDFRTATSYVEPGITKKAAFWIIYAFYRVCRLLDGWGWPRIRSILK